MLGTPSTRNSMNIKWKMYQVEGGGMFLFFRRGWTKRTKKVDQNLQESYPKPSRKWVKKTKETEKLQADLSRRFTPPADGRPDQSSLQRFIFPSGWCNRSTVGTTGPGVRHPHGSTSGRKIASVNPSNMSPSGRISPSHLHFSQILRFFAKYKAKGTIEPLGFQ